LSKANSKAWPHSLPASLPAQAADGGLTQPCTLSSFSGLVEDVGEEHVDLVKLLARVLFKAATATALASTGFSGATLSKTFTKTLISSSSSRAHLVEGGLEGLAAQLARKLARTGC